MDSLFFRTFVEQEITKYWAVWQPILHQYLLFPLESLLNRYYDYSRAAIQQLRIPHIFVVEEVVRNLSFTRVTIERIAGVDTIRVHLFSGTAEQASVLESEIRKLIDAILPLSSRYELEITRRDPV